MSRPVGSGLGPIRKRAGRSGYIGRVSWTDPSGKRCTRDVYGATEMECRLAMIAHLHAAESGGIIVHGAPKTVGELLTKWLQHVSGSIRPNTYAGWESLCRLHLIPELGHLPLSTLHQRDLNHAYERLRQTKRGGHHDPTKRLAGTYINGMHKLLCAAFLWAEREDLILRNPTRLIDKKLVKKSESDPRKIRALTDSEFDRIVEVVDAREDRALWLVLLTTGVRVGEMAGLKWESVDLREGTLRVENGIARVSGRYRTLFPDLRQVTSTGLVEQPVKTARSVRVVDLAAHVVEALRHHRRQRVARFGLPLPEWVFPMPDGLPMAQHHVNRLWHQIQGQVGIPTDRQMGLHGCRRTVATHDAQVGEPKAQQDKLGHVNQATTDTYVTAGQARLREHTDQRLRQALGRREDQVE